MQDRETAGNLGIADNVGNLFSWELSYIRSVFLQKFKVYVKMSNFAKNCVETTIIDDFIALSDVPMRRG